MILPLDELEAVVQLVTKENEQARNSMKILMEELEKLGYENSIQDVRLIHESEVLDEEELDKRIHYNAIGVFYD